MFIRIILAISIFAGYVAMMCDHSWQRQPLSQKELALIKSTAITDFAKTLQRNND